MDAAEDDDLSYLRSFTNGLRRDLDAVVASPCPAATEHTRSRTALPRFPAMAVNRGSAGYSDLRKARPSTARESWLGASGRQTEAAVAIVWLWAVKDSMTRGPA